MKNDDVPKFVRRNKKSLENTQTKMVCESEKMKLMNEIINTFTQSQSINYEIHNDLIYEIANDWNEIYKLALNISLLISVIDSKWREIQF